MFELRINTKGEKYLKYVDRFRHPLERGVWVEVAHEREKDAAYFVERNRKMGLQVERDERGAWRALVLSD